MKKKVVVGMSGGVDSSVAALLLMEQGYEVIGVTMQLRGVDPFQADEKGDCCGQSGAEDAGRVARLLGIPHYVMNFKEEFQKQVVDYFVGEYLNGRTPNPCIACNRYVKWESLLKRSMEIGADYIATGHYARIEQLENGRFAVRNSVAARKDQTYALYNLTQFQLSHTLMPAGDYTKEEIRAIAKKNHLPVAGKPDSQDICFVPDGNYADFIEREVRQSEASGRLSEAGICGEGCTKGRGSKSVLSESKLPEAKLPGAKLPGEGNFVTEDGTVIGKHKGIIHYTIGQRKGLGLSMGHPVFVSELRPLTNEVVISDQDVFCEALVCDQINFMGMEDLRQPRRLWAKVRYAHAGEWCMVYRQGEDALRCVFERPVRAVTPGQAVVFYEGEYVMGGGTIQ